MNTACIIAYSIFLIAFALMFWWQRCLIYALMMTTRVHMAQMMLQGMPIEQHEQIVRDFQQHLDAVRPLPKPPILYGWWVDTFSGLYDQHI